MYSSPQAQLATADELVAAMDEAGISRAVVCAFGWASHELCVQHNDAIIDAIQRYPERLVGYFAVDPGDERSALREIKRCVEAGLRGVGELRPDSQGWDLTERSRTEYLVDALKANDLPLLVHASEPVGHTYPGKGKVTPDRLESFISRHQDVTIILAHWGGGLPLYGLMPEVAELFSNVYVDTAASPYLYSPNIFRTVSGIIGIERVLFGSDFPLMPYSRMLEHLDAARLGTADREAIVEGNARRLLGEA